MAEPGTKELQAEVEKHHENLARWLGSEAEAELLADFESAHRPEFTLVTIDGAKLALPALMEALAASRNAAPGLKIRIEEFEVVVRSGDLTVCRFLEIHSVGTRRRTTAVLTADAQARYGVRWLAVQETAIL